VRASIEGVIVKRSSPPGLTAVMILLFLGNWKSTLIMPSRSAVHSGEHSLSVPRPVINIMTLGGLALAVRHPG